MSGKRLYALCQKVIEGLSYKKIALIMVGAMICSFGIQLCIFFTEEMKHAREFFISQAAN